MRLRLDFSKFIIKPILLFESIILKFYFITTGDLQQTRFNSFDSSNIVNKKKSNMRKNKTFLNQYFNFYLTITITSYGKTRT